MKGVSRVLLCIGIFTALSISGRARADIDVMDMWDNGTVPVGGVVYPNWLKVKVASFDVWLCEGCGAGTENIKGLTVVNFGTAGNADYAGVYWKARCGASDSGLYPMTYAGTYTEDSGPYPAWTWAGTSMDVSACADLCGNPLCGAYFTIDVYVDVAPCPTNLATVRMGFPIRSPGAFWGSISDNHGFFVPWGDTSAGGWTILYAQKISDLDTAAPGDTVTYTVFYGRPGVNPIQKFVVLDTQPPYTHYLSGSGVPAPESGWDPNPGPPQKLRWTVNGPFPTTGGPTGQISFDLSIDWGNGDSFEPGSGDTAAPEGMRLENQAQVFFNKAVPDCTGSAVTMPSSTTVRRFLYWMLGDNDVLFAPSYGQAPDEMIYSIFVKNMSNTKTWWDVGIWDTVPAELNTWCNDCGFEDPCSGWTMTPSGCAPAAPGRALIVGNTILTWALDMPPGMTLQLRWKAQVRPATNAGATAVSILSIREFGKTGIVDGTGASGAPRTFAQLAPIVLPTTYVSYVAHAASCIHNSKGECQGYFLAMFPLNRKTQFELRGLEYMGAGWPSVGGVSASIGILIGDCIGGFPGGGGISGGGNAGCKSERIPASYSPTNWRYTICPTWPQHNIYKLTSNSPVLWQYLPWITAVGDIRDENNTTAPSTTLTYCGLMHYMWKRNDFGTGNVNYGDDLVMMSTGLDAYGSVVPALETTVHLFSFDFTINDWNYERTYDLGPEGLAYQQGTSAAEAGPWRTVSSAVRMIVTHGSEINYMLDADVGGALHTFMPTRETGNNVAAGPATFYGVVPSAPPGAMVTVGNVGAAAATYDIQRYFPDNMLAPALMPAWLNGTSGRWVSVSPTFTLPAGFANPGNPQQYLNSPFLIPGSVAAYRVRLMTGGPIQVLAQGFYGDRTGGAVHHAIDGNQTGTEYWLHQTYAGSNVCPTSALYTVDVFCPRKDMVIQAVSEDGYSAHYTTTGPDQCVSFLDLTDLAWPAKRNVRFYLSSGSGSLIMQHIAAMNEQKGYTAPFIFAGTHYTIITPPIAFIGQSFWITVVVLDSGSTKTDYTGTSSFTSTDSGAKIQGLPMDGYNYVWVLGDAGVKVFINVTFTSLGLQNIVAQDTLDGSITGIAAILVVAADVKLEKRKRLSVAASGDTVQFWICWSNYSSSTAYSFTITDAVPNGTTYVPELASLAVCGQNGPFDASASLAASASTTTTPPTNFATVNPGSTAGSTTRWLRWTVRDVYVNSTGCVCFKVIVN